MKKLVILIALIIYSCEIENINYLTPIVFTDEPSKVLTNSATLGAEILAEGGKDITEYGLVWSTTNPPTINDTKVVKGERLGIFSDNYQSFEAGTTYYYCGYAINEVGVGYGSIFSFTTTNDPPCSPVLDNYVTTSFNTLHVNSVDISVGNASTSSDENVEFFAYSSGTTKRILIKFFETNHQFPQTGEYHVVYGFENSDNLSTGLAKLSIVDYGIGTPGGAVATPDSTFYVINENNIISFIFCDTPVGSDYILNGKFSTPLD